MDSKLGEIDESELAPSKAIKDENSRMRRINTNLTLENDALKHSSKKPWSSLSEEKVRACKRSGRIADIELPILR